MTGVLLGLLAASHATTLQQLSLDDMTRKSSEIVRGTVQCTGSGFRGSILYTNYRVKVSEQWKGTAASQFDFAVPGGFSNGIRQTYAGAPALTDGQEFVLFFWTGKSGLRQMIGLSQGLFTVTQIPTGQALASRSPTTDQMVDASGKPVNDPGFSMPVADLRSRVATTLTGASK